MSSPNDQLQRVLDCLREANRAMTESELAEKLSMESQQVGQHLVRLQLKGLATCDDPRRSKKKGLAFSRPGPTVTLLWKATAVDEM